MIQKDLTYGTDSRGDFALFIDEKHFISDGWQLSKKAQKKIKDILVPIFFRVINADGKEQDGHGWIKNGKVTQFG